MKGFWRKVNRGHVALACSIVGVFGRWITLASGDERGISRVTNQGDVESFLMISFILLAAFGLFLGVVSLFKAMSRWWGLAAILLTAFPLVCMLFQI